MLGASFDSVEANAKFAAKYNFPFKLLSDPKRTLGVAYGAAEAPDAEYAKRVSYLIGPDRRIVKAYPKVKPAEHPTQVLGDVPG